MLVQHLPHLAGHRIVLASASPRRHDLLRLLGLTFEVKPHPDKSITFLQLFRERARTRDRAQESLAQGTPPRS